LFYTGDYFLNDNKFGDIVAEFNNGCKFSFDILNILTSAFLYDLLRKFSSTATITTINEKSKIEILLTKYITEHCETVTLAELGRKFSYSDRQISRIIKKNTGLSYSELVQKTKMESTAKMLAETRIPIKKIIEMSGFSSKSYFFKIFRSYYGKTPLEYRNSGSPSEIDLNSRQRSG
jgi:YesN/AraC family two-component response regulator